MVRSVLPLASLDDLHRRHDGRPPEQVLRVAGLGGPARTDRLVRDAARNAHQRLAADAQQGAVRRRAALAGDAVGGDAWLARLTATLAHHRHAASRL